MVDVGFAGRLLVVRAGGSLWMKASAACAKIS